MLISYPFLCGTALNDDQGFSGSVATSGASSAAPRENPAQGLYPVTTSEGWHGGLHLKNPVINTPVRAIADGIVVAYRVSTRWKDGNLLSSTDASLKDHALSYNGWTDDGFVILKHEKECGEGKKVVFYSLYMHLSQLVNTAKGGPGEIVTDPKNPKDPRLPWILKRKEPLGNAGIISGRQNEIHFEIFMDEASLTAFFKPWDGWRDPWGDQYFRLKAGTHYYKQASPGAPQGDSAGSLIDDTWLAMRYEDGARIAELLDEDGECLARLRTDGVEPLLYKEAKSQYPDQISRGYELLRFGRFLGDWPGLDDPKPADPHSWVQLPNGGWVDVAGKDVNQNSDADFPPFRWNKLDGSKIYDPKTGICDTANFLTAMDANHDGVQSVGEFQDWIKDKGNRNRLRKLVVKFPSEWDGKDESRWDHVKDVLTKDPKVEQQAAKRRVAWLQGLVAYHAGKQPVWQKRLKEAQDREAAIRAQSTQHGNGRLPATQRRATHSATKEITPEARWQDTLSNAENYTKTMQARLDAVNDFLKNAHWQIERAERDLDEAMKKQANPENQKAGMDAFKNQFMPFIKKLQFWGQVPGLPSDSDVWHFHPLYFIEMFKKCHWLCAKEMEVLFPSDYYDMNSDGTFSRVLPGKGTSEQHRERYRAALIRVMWKHGLACSLGRMVHFIGQGREETGGLVTMVEGGSKAESKQDETSNAYYQDPLERYGMFYRYERKGNDLGDVEQSVFKNKRGELLTLKLEKNPKGVYYVTAPAESEIDPTQSHVGDGLKFRGRGMHQLTGRALYANYWVYRGWLNQKDFTASWWATKVKNPIPAPIPNPQRISTDAYSCIETSGFYWTICNVNKLTPGQGFDPGAVDKVTRVINGPGMLNRGKRKLFCEKTAQAMTDIPEIVDHTEKPTKKY